MDVASIIRSALNGKVEKEISDYVADTAVGLIDDIGSQDADAICTELQEAIGPLLEGSMVDDDVAKLCSKVAKAFKGVSEEGGASTTDAGKKEDYVVCCDGIILAYAGKSLLRSTSLRLVRGRRYGIVGQNGVGKTTLLNRISARDIAGFPQDICVVYVQHEILANDETNVLDYMRDAQARMGADQSLEKISAVLFEMGFDEAKQRSAVLELSGGWRMKLALAAAILRKADLLLLDEPTNHLDVNSVAWLAEFVCHHGSLRLTRPWQYLVKLENTTVIMVSHDYNFLDKAASDVIHFNDLTLTYYPHGWSQFAQARPDIIAALPRKKASSYFAEMNGIEEATIKFADPGALDGVKSRLKPIMRLTDVTFRYEGTDKDVLKNVTVKLCMASRVALVGPNGAGKSTLLKLLVGDLEQNSGSGDVWKHHNLRVAYIAQHSMHHLDENLVKTPITYIQDRFFQGRDKELSKMVTMALTEEEEAMRMKRGNIMEIVGRATRGGELCYQVRRSGRREEETQWEPMSNIKCKEPYVLKLVKNFDERMKAYASGVDVRPIHETEVRLHLQDFGIDAELATSKIKGFSGGQKSRVVLAAAMWNRPHLIALDEPTNYLDKETLRALIRALKAFKGAVLTISHNAQFVADTCNEKWELNGGRATMLPREDKDKPGAPGGQGADEDVGEDAGESEQADQADQRAAQG